MDANHDFKIIEHNLAMIHKTRKIRVGFATIYSSTFPAMHLYRLMMASSHFEPELVLVPDAFRSKNNYSNFISKQNDLLAIMPNPIPWAVDYKTNEILDVFSKYDIVCYSTPYQEMFENLHSITHLSKQGKLIFYINYSFGTTKYDFHWLSSEQLSLLWRAFVPTKFHARRWLKESSLPKKRIIVTGYPKIDLLDYISKIDSPRKRIILAPHHSIDKLHSEWSLGDFLQLSEMYAKIPELFPQVDFHFRPHPLLRGKLESQNIWGKKLTDEYFDRLLKLPNVILSNEANYMELFKNSDAMIHNCGSFLAEYLYTQNPVAFLISNKKLLRQSLHKFGRKCLKKHYLLYNIEEIIEFITQVVLNEHHSKRLNQNKFIRKYLKQKNISASQNILNEINKIFTN